MARLKYKSLSLKSKIELIKDVENGVKRKDIAAKFQIAKSTLSTIYKSKERYLSGINNVANLASIKRFSQGRNPDIDQAVADFIIEARSKNIPLTGEIIKEKAIRFGKIMNIDNFAGSSGWFSRFRKRQGLKWRCLTGDAAEADGSVAIEWIENYLKPILGQYDPNDIFNGDETGIFYRCFPGKSMVFKNDACKNGKRSKDRITVMLCCNMTGSQKIRPLVIGHAENPRCFKHIRSLPVDYCWNKKAWMTSKIFETWITEMDTKFQKENRKVIFFFDNCSAHPKDIQTKLCAITLHFFPPNLTSILQPMDRGIIRSLKVHYRNDIVVKLIDDMENNLKATKISVLDCINNISKIWETKVTPSIIQNCFGKAGFQDCEFDEISMIGSDGDKNFEKLASFPTGFNITDSLLNFDMYVGIDDNLETSAFITDEEIVGNIQKHKENDFEIQEECILDKTIEKVNSKDAKDSIITLLNYLEQTENVPEILFSYINEFRSFLNC